MDDPSELLLWRSQMHIFDDAGNSWAVSHEDTRDSNEGDVAKTNHEGDVYLGVDVERRNVLFANEAGNPCCLECSYLASWNICNRLLFLPLDCNRNNGS